MKVKYTPHPDLRSLKRSFFDGHPIIVQNEWQALIKLDGETRGQIAHLLTHHCPLTTVHPSLPLSPFTGHPCNMAGRCLNQDFRSRSVKLVETQGFRHRLEGDVALVHIQSPH